MKVVTFFSQLSTKKGIITLYHHKLLNMLLNIKEVKPTGKLYDNK
ncbi:hypothetical protein C5S35_17775 [Candidatus Methanophagaceae archaeon]|nr:hypothetical protein C5S35_17775 [Methanophagales archaeon]